MSDVYICTIYLLRVLYTFYFDFKESLPMAPASPWNVTCLQISWIRIRERTRLAAGNYYNGHLSLSKWFGTYSTSQARSERSALPRCLALYNNSPSPQRRPSYPGHRSTIWPITTSILILLQRRSPAAKYSSKNQQRYSPVYFPTH